jgi:hypothetical protein
VTRLTFGIRTREELLPCSGLQPQGLAERTRGGNPPPRQLFVANADARRVGAVKAGPIWPVKVFDVNSFLRSWASWPMVPLMKKEG